MEPDAQVVEEIEWLSRVGVGDKLAFDRIYERYAPRLYGVCRSLLGGAAEAEEALQDAFVAIWKYAKDYDPRLSRPFGWALVVTRRLCWTRLRARARRARRMDSVAEDPEAVVHPVREVQPADVAEMQDMAGRAVDALGGLPEAQRLCISLALLNGMSRDDIAKELNLPVGTVKTLIRRGLIKVGTEMGKEIGYE